MTFNFSLITIFFLLLISFLLFIIGWVIIGRDTLLEILADEICNVFQLNEFRLWFRLWLRFWFRFRFDSFLVVGFFRNGRAGDEFPSDRAVWIETSLRVFGVRLGEGEFVVNQGFTAQQQPAVRFFS